MKGCFGARSSRAGRLKNGTADELTTPKLYLKIYLRDQEYSCNDFLLKVLEFMF